MQHQYADSFTALVSHLVLYSRLHLLLPLALVTMMSAVVVVGMCLVVSYRYYFDHELRALFLGMCDCRCMCAERRMTWLHICT